MSADNYMLVRKHDGKFYVSMEFASHEGAPTPLEGSDVFDTLEEALDYANSEWTEYGVSYLKE